jgi:hypothetical protein
MGIKHLKTIRLVRNFLFSSVNREFLIFLFFFALSGIFWLLMTLNGTYEREIKIPVRLVNIPKNVVVSETVDTMSMTVKDKGWFIAALIYGDRIRPVNIDFSQYFQKKDGICIVSPSDIQKQLLLLLSSSARVTSMKPEKLYFYYSFGESKKVPVRFSGKIVPVQTYYLSKMVIQPDSVTVYASQDILDKIKYVSTENLHYENVSDTLSVRCKLHKIRGAKISPQTIKILMFTDILTEEHIDVPIIGENMPEGKVLRTFPAKVTVKFVTGMSNFRRLRPEDFTVVVNYNELANHPSDKCTLYLRTMPHGISHARLEINNVDYLIEEE